jgi:Ca2+-transporting ATPase
LTGESQPIDKFTQPLPDPDLPLGDRRNMAYMGTLITHGRGRGVVVETATGTEFGQIATMLHATEEVETPLQKRLEHFGKRLAFVALTVAAVIFVLGLLRGEPLTLMFMTAISLAVAAIRSSSRCRYDLTCFGRAPHGSETGSCSKVSCR